MSNLKQKYLTEVVPALQKQFGYKSVMQVPRLEKIVINMGIGDATSDAKLLEAAVEELEAITGQKPVVTKAKKSIASFKLREHQAIGCKVTLRAKNMWNFAEKLFGLALPRVRDFRGLNPNSFDGRGNYTIGIKEQIIFNEIVYDKVKKVRGMDVTFVTSTDDNDQAYELLLALGLPFVKKTKKDEN